MTTKHTKGPWSFVPKITANENHSGYFVRAEKIKTNGMWSLALVQPGDDDGLVGEANAKLIAAAPDLLAACKAFVAVDDTGVGSIQEMMSDYAAALKAARAVIAKATA